MNNAGLTDIPASLTSARQQLAEVAMMIIGREPTAAETILLIADVLGQVAWLASPTPDPPTPAVLLHLQHHTPQ
jgi:hypothetical protein